MPVCLQDQGIDNNGFVVGRVRWAHRLSNNNGGVNRGRRIGGASKESNSMLFRQTYSAFCKCTYNSASPFFPYEIYLRYSAESAATISSYIVSRKIMNMLLCMFALMYVHGISTNSTYHSLDA